MAERNKLDPDTHLADTDWLARQARGFGAGFVDPFGMTGYGARGMAHMMPSVISPDSASAFANRLGVWRDEAPVAAAMGGMLIPGFGAGRIVGLTAREALSPGWLGNLSALGGIGGNVYETFRDAIREDERDRQSVKPLPGAPY